VKISSGAKTGSAVLDIDLRGIPFVLETAELCRYLGREMPFSPDALIRALPDIVRNA
jgi:hypothetical protein